MKQVFLIGGLVALAACGVPPEEDAAAKVGFASSDRAGAAEVTREDLEQSSGWAELLKQYR